MIIYYKRAIKDIFDHRFLNAVTIVTIAVAILIASSFALFFVNANAIVNSWKKGIRIMVYLKPNSPERKVDDIKSKIEVMKGVKNVRFISNKEALQRLKNQMKRQSSLLDDLQENPLPDAFEVQKLLLPVWNRFRRWMKSNMDRYGWGDLPTFSICSD